MTRSPALPGKIALITGHRAGIGAATAALLGEFGVEVHGFDLPEVDLAVPEAVAAHVEALRARSGRLDLLVNNAGLAGANALDGDDALWHAVIDTNLHGTYYLCKAALPHLPAQRGRVINIASVLALRGVPDQSAYCAAKHAVLDARAGTPPRRAGHHRQRHLPGLDPQRDGARALRRTGARRGRRGCQQPARAHHRTR